MFYLILAHDTQRGIGLGDSLPWRLKKDMAFFKAITTSSDLEKTEEEFGLISFNKHGLLSNAKNPVIMGRKTYESIPSKFRPLPSRSNIVLTSDLNAFKYEKVIAYHSLQSLLHYHKLVNDEVHFITGGASLYNDFSKMASCTRIYLTEVEGDFGCDTFVEEFPKDFVQTSSTEWKEENGIKFRFKILER